MLYLVSKINYSHKDTYDETTELENLFLVDSKTIAQELIDQLNECQKLYLSFKENQLSVFEKDFEDKNPKPIYPNSIVTVGSQPKPIRSFKNLSKKDKLINEDYLDFRQKLKEYEDRKKEDEILNRFQSVEYSELIKNWFDAKENAIKKLLEVTIIPSMYNLFTRKQLMFLNEYIDKIPRDEYTEFVFEKIEFYSDLNRV